MTLEDEIMDLQTYKMFEGEDTVYVRRDDILELLEQEPCVKPTTEDAIKTIQELMMACTPDSKYYRVGQMAIKALEQKPCDDSISRSTFENNTPQNNDAISRKSIKQKLQEHHDFFVNAYGGFSNLPQNDKARVDEITNCIAMVVNEPSVRPQEPKTGYWENTEFRKEEYVLAGKCSVCGKVRVFDEFCSNCGADMRGDKE